MKTKHQAVALIAVLLIGCGGSSSNAPLVNTAPTVSAITDQSTAANRKSAAIQFTVSDTDPASLSVSASSDNQAVLPDSGLELGGSGANRSLTATPIVDTLGDAFVTLIVTDQANLSASTSFLLTVAPEQASVQQFTRATFSADEIGDPELINAIAFDQDADEDDFADLLVQ